VKFNKENANKELPPGQSNQTHVDISRSCHAGNDNQGALERALEFELTGSDQEAYVNKLREIGRTKGINKTLQDYDIDVIIGPAESGLTQLSSAAGR
jgi:amidase